MQTIGRSCSTLQQHAIGTPSVAAKSSLHNQDGAVGECKPHSTLPSKKSRILTVLVHLQN